MGLLVRERKSVRVCSREGTKVESTHVRVVGLSVFFRYCCLLLAVESLQWITSKRRTAKRRTVLEILEYAIRYSRDGSYTPNLTKDKKRAVRKRAALLTVDKGEVFFTRGKAKVKVLVNSNIHVYTMYKHL